MNINAEQAKWLHVIISEAEYKATQILGIPVKMKITSEPLFHNSSDSLNQIITAVCNEYLVTHDALIKRERTPNVCEARQMAWLLCRKKLNMTLPKIGFLFKRDHAAVIYGINRITGLIETEAEVKKSYNNILQQLSINK